MSRRIFIPNRRTAVSSLVNNGVIARGLGTVNPAAPASISAIANPDGGFFIQDAADGGSTAYMITSIWLLNPPTSITAQIVVGPSNTNSWYESWNTTGGQGMLSQSSFGNHAIQSQLVPQRNVWDNYIWSYDGDLPAAQRVRWWRNGVEFLRNNSAGTVSTTRALTTAVRYFDYGTGSGGVFPLICEGVGEVWHERGRKWTNGDETKFISGGEPANLGANGETPYGSPPNAYFGRAMTTADWNNGVNLGTDTVSKSGSAFQEFIPT